MRSLLGLLGAGLFFCSFQEEQPADPDDAAAVAEETVDQTPEQAQFEIAAAPLRREIAYLDGMFPLTDQQRSRLELAIKGAVKHYQASLKKPRLMLADSSGFSVFVRGQARALGMDVSQAFIPLEPLWVKAVSSTLTPDQFKRFETEQAARLKYRRRARVLAMVARLDSRLMFSAEQRTLFERMVDSEFGDDLENTWGDHRVLSYFEFQVLNLDSEKLQPILDERQIEEIVMARTVGWWRGDEWGNPMLPAGGGAGFGGGLGGGGLGWNPAWGVPGGGIGGGGGNGGGGFF